MKQDRYYLSGGRYVPSGTTVLPRPDLARWAANCAVDYILLSPSSSCVDISHYGCKIEWDPESYFPEARTAYQRESREAADYGTYIHKLCEVSLLNDIKIESPHEMTQKFMDGLWSWKTKHNVKVIVMEHEVLSDWYGGRLDLVCEMNAFWMTKAWCARYDVKWHKGIDKQRVVVLVDFKTANYDVYHPEWKYQLAGYRQAWNKIQTKDSMSHGMTLEPFNRKDAMAATSRYLKEWPLIQHHGILKFNKQTLKVNYKDFTIYEATRPTYTWADGKIETEKYVRTYDIDRQTFNSFVASWWLTKRGIKI